MSAIPRLKLFTPIVALATLSAVCFAQSTVRDRYEKQELNISMRDGVKLFTAVYSPRDKSRRYPFLMIRTPYSVGPYGASAYRDSLGPNPAYEQEGFIFVYQDVRGRYMSEGEFSNMRPQLARYAGPKDIDESTDTYDTIDWLVKNVPNNNGRAGVWGISYPGFYAAAATINSHPALKAASPQAPIADWFVGDDFHHRGAFFLIDGFNFMNGFGRPRAGPTTSYPPGIQHGTPDGYKFFLELGPLKNADAKYFKGQVSFWNDMMRHGTYDEFWKSRNLLPHLKNVKCAVLVVGGFFDAEDLYGPLAIYESIERNNPGIVNTLCMGPWFHGGWVRSDGAKFGDIEFGGKTSILFQNDVEFPFFMEHLKGIEPKRTLPEAFAFATGSNEWLGFDAWPPKAVKPRGIYLQSGGKISTTPTIDTARTAFDEYLSDPGRPVPYRSDVSVSRNREYMIADQRFAATRPDVLVYQSDPLKEPMKLAGPIDAELWITTTGTDADFVVKLIDVFPDTFAYPRSLSTEPPNVRTPEPPMGGYQMLVRGEVMRGKFRNSYERPEPFVPGKPTLVNVPLPDVCHTFLPGHRIMVQVQSSWFPLVDRNPQSFVDIYSCDESAFQKATHRVLRSAVHRSVLRVRTLE